MQNDSFLKKASADEHVALSIQFFKSCQNKSEMLSNSLSAEQVSKQGMDFTDDPFSHQVSIVAPSFCGSFQNEKSKRLFEMLVKSNFPAHVKITPVWLGLSEMYEFERIYHAWRETKATGTAPAKLDDLSYILLRILQNKQKNQALVSSDLTAMIKVHV